MSFVNAAPFVLMTDLLSSLQGCQNGKSTSCFHLISSEKVWTLCGQSHAQITVQDCRDFIRERTDMF